MYIQDFFVKYYDYRPFNSVFFNKLVGNFSKIGAVIASVFLPTWFRLFPSVKSISKRQDGLVICMTSFPARIDYVWLVVECLLRQTIQAEDIVLYLSKKQFPTKDKLPSQLLNMELNHKVTIKMENEDYRSHKKYWYALRDFPNKTIITVDDDIIYDSKLIEQLIVFSKKHPMCIPGRFISTICYDNGSEHHVLPYSKWSGRVDKGSIGANLFFGSGGGTLFPVGSLRGANIPFEEISKICPLADDIWLNAWVRKNGYVVGRVSRYASVPEWIIRNNKKLCSINNGENKNDVQLFKTIDYFKTRFDLDPFAFH